MLLFTSETSQHNVLPESLDTIKRSCTKDDQKSHCTHRHVDNNSGHRVTGCLTQTKNKKDSILSGMVLIAFYKHFTENSLKKICFSVIEKVRK